MHEKIITYINKLRNNKDTAYLSFFKSLFRRVQDHFPNLAFTFQSPEKRNQMLLNSFRSSMQIFNFAKPLIK